MWWFIATAVYLLIGFLLSIWLIKPIMAAATGYEMEDCPNLWEVSPALGLIVTLFWGLILCINLLAAIGRMARKTFGEYIE